jgi:hypothetical protein
MARIHREIVPDPGSPTPDVAGAFHMQVDDVDEVVRAGATRNAALGRVSSSPRTVVGRSVATSLQICRELATFTQTVELKQKTECKFIAR